MVVLDQENDLDLDEIFLISDERLTRFSETRFRILGRVKGLETPSVQGPQYYEEYLVVCDRDPRGLKSHQSVILLPTGTMCMVFKYVTMVPVLISNKSQS